jgi:hypothetical protein
VLPVLVLQVRPELRVLQERPVQESPQRPVLAPGPVRELVLLPLPASALLPSCIQLPQTIMSQRKAGKEK